MPDLKYHASIFDCFAHVLFLFLPEVFDPATFLHDAPEFVGGSVACHDVEGTTRTRVLEGGIQAGLAVVYNLDLVSWNIGVFQAHGQFFGFTATAYYVADIFGNLFNIYIPEPGEIFAVHNGIAGNDQGVLFGSMLGNQAQHQVERGGVFDKSQVDGLVTGLNFL